MDNEPLGYSWKRVCLPLWKGEGKDLTLKLKVEINIQLLSAMNEKLYFYVKGEINIKIIKPIAIIITVCLLVSCQSSSIHEPVKEAIKEGQSVKRLSQYEDKYIYGVYHLLDNEKDEIIQLVKQKGFVDEIDMMVIIDNKEAVIKNIEILEHSESKDYGDLLTEEWFLERFKGKSIAKPLTVAVMSAKEENQVVAITGATITSRAVANGVNLCMSNYQRIKGE